MRALLSLGIWQRPIRYRAAPGWHGRGDGLVGAWLLAGGRRVGGGAQGAAEREARSANPQDGQHRGGAGRR